MEEKPQVDKEFMDILKRKAERVGITPEELERLIPNTPPPEKKKD